VELKDFLKKIRAEDEGRKKKFVIVASLLILTVVMLVWLKFFGGFLSVKFPKV
jgi:hypothetical protein